LNYFWNANIIKNASPARANRTRGGSLYAQKTYGGQGLVSKTLTPKQAARQAEITKELNPVRKKSTVSVKKKTTVAAPKSNVRVKPAAKQVGNPPNQSKALEEMISSVSRGSIRQGGPAGKAKTTRKFNSKKK
jgi:hypothetical protein